MALAARGAGRRALAVHVYVSEGRDRAFVGRLAAAASAHAGVAVANEFLDAAYHRAGLTLASRDEASLEAAVAAVCSEALSTLDLRSHCASHPRVGVVDHVACNPLGAASCGEAGAFALRVARALAAPAEASRPALPVYLYGAAREDGRPLSALRRSLNYFGGSARGHWEGLPEDVAAAMRALPPDLGPSAVDPQHGAAVVGAVPWVTNYNVLLCGDGVDKTELMSRCRRVARSVSARGGGLPAVESMALPHEGGVEVACNLLDIATSAPDEVLARVEQLARDEGLHVDSHYVTNKLPEEVLDLALAAAATGFRPE